MIVRSGKYRRKMMTFKSDMINIVRMVLAYHTIITIHSLHTLKHDTTYRIVLG
jgi:hypothetical protein